MNKYLKYEIQYIIRKLAFMLSIYMGILALLFAICFTFAAIMHPDYIKLGRLLYTGILRDPEDEPWDSPIDPTDGTPIYDGDTGVIPKLPKKFTRTVTGLPKTSDDLNFMENFIKALLLLALALLLLILALTHMYKEPRYGIKKNPPISRYKLNRHIPWQPLLLAAIPLFVFGFIFARNSKFAAGQYNSSESYYEDLRDSTPKESLKEKVAYVPTAVKKPVPTFKSLFANPGDNAVGWLRIPDTNIDYPVMQTGDNMYYLSHLPDGTKNAGGSIFLDCDNNRNFKDQLNIIYGHHMKNGTMFKDLVKYKEQEFYDTHKKGYLYLPDRDMEIEIAYGFLINGGYWYEMGYSSDIEGLLLYASTNSTFDGTVKPEPYDDIILLSTCSYEFEQANYIILGRLIKAI